MPSVHIENIGPIADATFAIDSPGVYVIEGAAGCGKTTALRTIQLVVDGRCDVKPTKRDGANRGLAEVAGKTIRVSKTTRTEGELQIEGLGDLSIVDLHSPKFVDAKTRDRHRIITLCRLAGVEAKPELFYDLLGGKADFREVVSTRLMETDDLVEMANRVKAEIERESRRIEEQRKTALADAKAQLTIAEGVDTASPCDEQAAQRNLEDAIRDHGKLKEKREAWLRTREAADKARARLAELPPGKSVAEATAALEQAKEADLAAQGQLTDIERQIAELQQKYELLKAEQNNTRRARDAAGDALRDAKNAVSLRGELDSAIEAASGAVETTEDDVDDASIAVGTARRAIEQCMQIRAAQRAKAKATEFLEKAGELEQKSNRLRDAAAGTFEVLSNAIANLEDCPLRVRMSEDGDPRLVVETDRSEHEPFDELSGGERWDLVMRIATRRNRLIPFPQEAFGELAPSLRNQLHETAKAHGAYVVTAVATDGELRGVPYEPAHVEAAE